MPDSNPAGLYIHTPFCRTKCRYCDFYSIPAPSPPADDWLEALEKEALLYVDQFQQVDTIYLGGGTPTILKAADIMRLMAFFYKYFHILESPECTIEANPNDIRHEFLEALKGAGFNRISLGVQSLNDEELQFLGRRHRAREVFQAMEAIRDSGFQNVGLDLIYGLPEQSEASWLKTLERALALRPQHLSCYQLTLAEGTPLGKMKNRGEIKPLSEELERRFYCITSEFLEAAGYTHYEISSFARKDAFICRHNQKYWSRKPYLGLGPSAHSFTENRRWWNCRSIRQYSQKLREGLAPTAGKEVLTEEQIKLEMLSLGLRTKKGIAIEDLKCYSKKAGRILPELINKGYVEVTGGRVIPTREGFLVADRLPLIFG